MPTCEDCGKEFETVQQLAGHKGGTLSGGNDEWKANRIEREKLIAELVRVAEMLNKRPSAGDMQEHGKWSQQPYYREFGSWNDAIKEIGFEPYVHGDGQGNHYLTCAEWKGIREKVIQRDGERCRRCGIARETHIDEHGRDLDVHHITPRSDFENTEESHKLSNLIALCNSCHNTVEGRDWFQTVLTKSRNPVGRRDADE